LLEKHWHVALIRGLTQANPNSIVAAADGLMTCNDATACSALVAAITHDDPTVRYHIIQAAATLNCLDERQLTAIAHNDPDRDVRDLAMRLLAKIRSFLADTE
jgi:HEAT repeat protein